MPFPIALLAMTAGSALLKHFENKRQEKNQYNQSRAQAEQEFNQRLQAYNAQMEQFKIRQAMLRKYLESDPELKSLAPKEYLDALNKDYSPKVTPQFGYQPFSGRSSAWGAIGTNLLDTASSIWPKTPQLPYGSPGAGGGMNVGTSIFKPSDLMGSYSTGGR
jgi:hypothetical protein